MYDFFNISERKPTSMKSIEPRITDNDFAKHSQHDLYNNRDSSGAPEHNRFCVRCCPRISKFYKKRRLCILISYFILGQDLIFDPSD